jgi:tetratricopeptide (TPR) repeat protein
LSPDIVCLSKSLSGFGLPMAVTLIRPELDAWSPGEHDATFRGNNHAFVTAAAAIETYWQDEVFSEEIAAKAAISRAGLERIGEASGAEVRGRGLIQGLAWSDPRVAGAASRAAFERGLVIDEHAHDDDHLHAATVLCNLGPVLQDLGDLAGARAALERALAIDEHVHGPDHPHVATVLCNLGVVLWTLGDLVSARTSVERSLAIRDRALGRHHPDTARSLGWLGTLDAASGALPSARPRLREAISILRDFLPADHPDIQRFEEQVARLS